MTTDSLASSQDQQCGTLLAMLLKSLSLRHRAFRISLTAADPAPWPTSYKFDFYNGGPSFSRPIARTADPAHPIFFFKRSGLATAVDSFVAAR